AIVERLLDQAEPNGHMAIISELSYPLPVTVIAETMGIPHADHARLKAWSGQIIEFMASPKPSIQVLTRSQNALIELRETFRVMLEQRRHVPEEDVLTLLVEAEEAGDSLTMEEVISTCVTILIGGHETTTNLIASG